jgi:hypothetical protein
VIFNPVVMFSASSTFVVGNTMTSQPIHWQHYEPSGRSSVHSEAVERFVARSTSQTTT